MQAVGSDVAIKPGKRSDIKLREFFEPHTWPFWGVHMWAFIGVPYFGWDWKGIGLAIGVYYAYLFFVTAGYHRYLSHRAFKTSRVFQFILALGATLTIQKGPLWWAANHRHHHKRSDEIDDIHSPIHGGFWWSHVGWILVRDYEKTKWANIKDMAKYPELRWLDKYFLIPPIAYATILGLVGGHWWLIWGFAVPTTLAWHGTFTINSLSHVFGRRRYQTSDDSRNNWLLALITLGEGWHNNHHHYQRAANQGFKWYEIDITYYILKMLSWVGVVWDVHKAPAHVVENRPKHAPKPTAPAAAPAPALDRAA